VGRIKVRSSEVRAALHVTALWALAVAQPIYDVLQRNGEFFVAHRATPLDLLVLVFCVSLALPLAAAGLGLLLSRTILRPLVKALFVLAVGVLVAALTSRVLVLEGSLSTRWHIAISVAIGAAAAWAYYTTAVGRSVANVLVPAIVLCPAFFLLQPSMAPFVRPKDRTQEMARPVAGTPPPIVFVIFDQLPLVSLMRPDGHIDAATYPSFGALAAHATWYRNASTVGDLTGWAVPAILSGRNPLPRRLPTAQHHPGNLFTLLGSTYRFEVFEPITRLCPTRLCGSDEDPASVRLMSMAGDASVVYLHSVLPPDWRQALPPLTENWKGFIQNQHWQRRWVHERDSDRRKAPAEFVRGISRTDPQPTIYFLHALLPHEPYVYMRSGQQAVYDTRLPGLGGTGRWTNDHWPVVQAYQRHLTQVRFVDTLLGRILARLEAEGLYDQSLIVVTGDHGVSFRPGHPFKGIDGDTLPDIMSVPLFIKTPGQREGRVDDSNVQSIDVVATIADLLDVDLSWPVEGRSLLDQKTVRPDKTIYYSGANLEKTVDASEFARLRINAVLRKSQLFAPPAPLSTAPVLNVVPDVVGTRTADLRVRDDSDVRVLVEAPERFRSVDLTAPAVPAFIRGRVEDEQGRPASATLAITVNGVVAATTRTYRGESGADRGEWTALIDPRWLRPAQNELEVLTIRDTPAGAVYARAFASAERPRALNLASRAAASFWGVDQTGLGGPEQTDAGPFRRMSGDATLVAPADMRTERSLRVGVALVPSGGRPLTVAVNGCTVFNGRVAAAPWYRTFSLSGCPATALSGSVAKIELHSSEAAGDEDAASQDGLGIATIDLFQRDWPPAAEPASRGRGLVRLLTDRPALVRSDVVRFEIRNAGDTIWLDRPTSADRAIDLTLRWRSSSRRGAPSEQRLALPHAFYPGDEWTADLPLVPPTDLDDDGPWRVEIALASPDGSTVPSDAPLVLDVQPEKPALAVRR
jgi:hypothetical protein